MALANDNGGRSRRVRDGLAKRWPDSNFEAISSEEALLRLAEARNTASKSANKFMLVAAVIAGLYFLRLNGLGQDIKIGEYSLAKLPFGLFVLSASALIMSTVSLIRIGDSRSYDRHLLLACEKRFAGERELRYLAFPNEQAWGEPFSRMVNVIEGGRAASILRSLSLLFSNLFLLFLALSPLIVGIDFLLYRAASIESDFRQLLSWLVVFFVISNLSILALILWARLADRD